mgnify:CR=1 FL=1
MNFRYLYEFTYPELLETDTPVIDSHGVMWAGKDRKGMNAPNPKDLWLKWQREVKENHDEVHQRIRDYFQSTKFFNKPPKKEDMDRLMDNFKDTPALVDQLKKGVTPRFTWSPTKLQQFATCPRQFAAQHYYKTLPYQETEATIWGNRVHKAAEDYLTGKGVTDPEAFKPVEKWCKVIERITGERMIEEKISVDGDFKTCSYDDGVGRMIADVAVLSGNTLYVFDWKTGKVKQDQFQLRVYSLLLAIKYPQIEKIVYKYIWVKDDVVTGGELLRKELVPVAKELRQRIEEVKRAWDNENFPTILGGLCKKWCGVTDCPHCGGGR